MGGAPAYGAATYGTQAYGTGYGGSASYALQPTYDAAPPTPTLATAQSMIAYPSMPSAMNGPFQFYPNDAPGVPGSSASAAQAPTSGAGQANMNAMSSMGSSAMNAAGGTAENAASTMAASAPGGNHGKASANKPKKISS